MINSKKHDIQIISYLARKLGLGIKELKEPVLSDFGMFSKAKAILYLANKRAIAVDALRLIKEDFYVIDTKLYLQVFDELEELDFNEGFISDMEKLEIDFIVDAYKDNNVLYKGLKDCQELKKFYITPENILRTRKEWGKKEKLNWLIEEATFDLEDEEISKLSENLENQSSNNIVVPEFKFNGITCKNVDFVWMGQTPDKKDIYMSKDCLPKVHVSMDNLLKINGTIQTDKGIGECDIGKAAEASLDSAVFAITKKHLQEYTREYDGSVHKEKVFFPLECEVFGDTYCALDTKTLDKYPQWEGFKGNTDSKIKYTGSIIGYLDCPGFQYETGFWWEANKTRYPGFFCLVDEFGLPLNRNSDCSDEEIGIAFCL